MGLFGKKKAEKQEQSAGGKVTLEDGTEVTVNKIVDCIGDSCPRPQLMTKAAMDKASSGDVIEVKIDNSTSVEALPPMMADLNGTHLGTLFANRQWQVILQKN